MLEELITDARERGRKCLFWAQLWQVADLGLGLATAVLAAVAGATGLASAAGRVPAAIMALTAAALTAGTRFLRSNERYARNWRRYNSWQVLERDARFASASEGYPGTRSLYESIQALLEGRIAILEIDHLSIPREIPGKATAREPGK
jgi:hypothetical protein